MRTMQDTLDIKAIVTEHPRLVGVLFALIFLLSQVGTVAAGAAGVVTGP